MHVVHQSRRTQAACCARRMTASHRPPTDPHNRLSAVRLYVRAERLCDEQDSDGIKMMKRAIHTAWELGCEEWPAWAEALYERLQKGGPFAEEPILTTRESASAFQPELASIASSASSESVARAVASALSARNLAVRAAVPPFLPCPPN